MLRTQTSSRYPAQVAQYFYFYPSIWYTPTTAAAPFAKARPTISAANKPHDARCNFFGKTWIVSIVCCLLLCFSCFSAAAAAAAVLYSAADQQHSLKHAAQQQQPHSSSSSLIVQPTSYLVSSNNLRTSSSFRHGTCLPLLQITSK